MTLRIVVGDHAVTGTLATYLPGAAISVQDEPELIGSFRAMVRGLSFDVCEMALTTYLCARAHGRRFSAIPVFPVRRFHHGAIVGLPEVVAAGPGALGGRRVGVSRGYTVTTGVWARGILEDEHGLDPATVTWVRSGDEHVAEVRLPANVVDLEPGADLAAELLAGRLAAVVGGRVEGPGIAPLVPDPAAAALAALDRRGLFPINHCVVVRDELLEERPSLAAELAEAFAAAKADYLERLNAGTLDPVTPDDATYAAVRERAGADPVPYGLEANRATLERLVDHALSQKILETRPQLSSLFAPGSLDREA